MSKNKNIIAKTFFLIIAIWFSSFQKVFAIDENGVWGSFNVIEDSGGSYTYQLATLRESVILDNIDFSSSNPSYPNLDAIGDFAIYRRNASAPHKYADVSFENYIYAPNPGNTVYYFSVEKSDKIDFRFNIENKLYRRRMANLTAVPPVPSSGILRCDADTTPPIDPQSCNPSTTAITLAQGWHKFSGSAYVDRYEDVPTIKLKWGTSSNVATHTTIPKERFLWKNTSSEEIIIPEMTNPEEKINFYTAGVGVEEYLDGDGTGDGDPKINLEIPVGPTSDDFSKDAYVFWFDNTTTDPNPEIIVQNTSISGSPQQPLTGIRLETSNSAQYPLIGCYARIPSNLIGFDGARNMNFVFKGLTFANNPYGIGIVIPYEDETLNTTTRLYLKIPGSDPYRGTHPPITFDLDDDIDKTNLKPVFFFGNGETRFGGSYRPNFMSMISDTGNRPAENDFFYDDSRAIRIYPKPSAGTYDINNPNTWNPAFGREGLKFDVLSTLGTYLPNKLNSYVGQDAIIDTINVGTDNWISFQYYSSNFIEDNAKGDPESTELLAVGLLGGEKNQKLKICPSNLSSSISVGDKLEFKALYWAEYNGAGNYCDPSEIATATENASQQVGVFSSNASVANANGVSNWQMFEVEAFSKGSTKIKVTKTVDGVELESNEVDIIVSGTETCNYNLCDKSTNYECKEVLGSGDGCLQTPKFKDVRCNNLGDTCKPDGWKEATP